MDRWMDGWMEGGREGGMEGWRDGGMEGWRDGGIGGWRDGRIHTQTCKHPWHMESKPTHISYFLVSPPDAGRMQMRRKLPKT